MSIEAKNISKTFGEFKALTDVSLTVPDGELVALLGPSGSGKTTLLRIISGLETPDPNPGSAILFQQHDVAQTAVGERHVGFVFQHYALFKHMNVFENIAFGLRVKPKKDRPGKSQIADKVMSLLKLVQMEGLAQRYPAQLSGGQRQRIALARALAIEPKVLLLDEPFGAPDAKVRLDLRRWLRKLHDEIHVTSLFVTHDQQEALEVSDRIVVMNEGRIEQIGTPEEVFHKPATEFVMNFLGEVNRFHGKISQGKPIINADGKPAAPSTLFVRPYDMDIFHEPQHADDVAVMITRIQAAGSLVKIELMRANGQPINVEMTHERYRDLQLNLDQNVYVSPRAALTFNGDFSI